MPRAQKGQKLKRQLSDGKKKTMPWRLDARQTLFHHSLFFFFFGPWGGVSLNFMNQKLLKICAELYLSENKHLKKFRK